MSISARLAQAENLTRRLKENQAKLNKEKQAFRNGKLMRANLAASAFGGGEFFGGAIASAGGLNYYAGWEAAAKIGRGMVNNGMRWANSANMLNSIAPSYVGSGMASALPVMAGSMNVSRNKLTTGYYNLLSAGMGQGKFQWMNANNALSTTAKLSKIGFTNIGEVAKTIGTVTRASKGQIRSLIPRSFFTKIGDAIAYTIKNQQITMKPLMAGFKYAAPTISAFNQSPQQMIKLLGWMNTQGLQGSTAGTGVSNFFNKVGGIAAKFGIAVKNKNGAYRSFTDLMQEVSQRGGSDVNEQLLKALGIRGGRGALIAKNKINDLVNFMKKGGEGGSLNEMFNKMNKGVGIRAFGGAMSYIKSDVGRGFISAADMLENSSAEYTKSGDKKSGFWSKIALNYAEGVHGNLSMIPLLGGSWRQFSNSDRKNKEYNSLTDYEKIAVMNARGQSGQGKAEQFTRDLFLSRYYPKEVTGAVSNRLAARGFDLSATTSLKYMSGVAGVNSSISALQGIGQGSYNASVLQLQSGDNPEAMNRIKKQILGMASQGPEGIVKATTMFQALEGQLGNQDNKKRALMRTILNGTQYEAEKARISLDQMNENGASNVGGELNNIGRELKKIINSPELEKAVKERQKGEEAMATIIKQNLASFQRFFAIVKKISEVQSKTPGIEDIQSNQGVNIR